MICDGAPQIDIRKLTQLVDEIPDLIHFDGERIVTTRTDTAFGGHRCWFLCPSCNRRCAIIYRKGAGPRWGCRVCMGGRYLSEHMSSNDRRLHKAFKARERLGQQQGGILAPFPSKPKGMRWQTYERIRDSALTLEKKILAEAIAGTWRDFMVQD